MDYQPVLVMGVGLLLGSVIRVSCRITCSSITAASHHSAVCQQLLLSLDDLIKASFAGSYRFRQQHCLAVNVGY